MRRVFFSFHFQLDSVKVGQIRNSHIGNAEFKGQPYLDKAQWETIKAKGGVRDWIETQMKGTSVTIVLIGAETLQRPWVKYEMQRTAERGAGMFGIDLSGMKGFSGQADYTRPTIAGSPFERKAGWNVTSLPIYNWINDNGRANMSRWIEQAAQAAGR